MGQVASTEQTPRLFADALWEVISDATETSHLGGIPSGHLYAALMDMLSLDAYNGVIEFLISEGAIKQESSYLLVALRPYVEVPR